MTTRWPVGSHDARAHPEPWMVLAASMMWALNGANPPKLASICSATQPDGSPPPSGGEALPEQAVQHVAGQVERQFLLQHRQLAVVAAGPCFLQALDYRVGAGDVGGVVLGVVKLHDSSREVRFERRSRKPALEQRIPLEVAHVQHRHQDLARRGQQVRSSPPPSSGDGRARRRRTRRSRPGGASHRRRDGGARRGSSARCAGPTSTSTRPR